MVCGGFIQHVGRVGRQHSVARACRHVDVVVADRDIGDDFQLRALGEQRGIYAVAAGDQCSISIFQRGRQFRRRPGDISFVVFDVEIAFQVVDQFRKNAPRNNDMLGIALVISHPRR